MPLDGKLAVLKYIEGTGQPDTSLSAGRDIVPFFLCGYADDKWYGQPWYYRGRYRDGDAAGLATTGLYDVDSQSGTLLNLADRGPALLVFDKHRLRQVLTPPGDFPGTAFAQICVHAWRWTSLNGHGASTRLGVRILRVSSTSGTNVTSSLLKVWPKSGASGSNIFYDSNNVGPFVAFPTGSFNDFGMIPDPYQPAKILSITPSNLRFTPNDNNPSSEDFEKKVGILTYAKMNLDASLSFNGSVVSFGNNYRYIIEFAAEAGSAYALQVNTNTHSLINKLKNTNNGLATPNVGDPPNSPIDIPQIWPCGQSAGVSVDRNYNSAGKFYANSAGGGDWVDMFDQMLPVCLVPSS